MAVSVENLGGLERRMTLIVSANKIEQDISKRVKKLSSSLRIDGFRPGKIPPQVILQKFGNDVREEAVQEEMSVVFEQAVAQEKIVPAGNPRFEPLVNNPGKDVEFTATFEILPDVEVPSLKGVTIEKWVTTITDADIDRVIESLRKQRTHWKSVERAAQEGDQLLIDFEGSIDGTPFAGGSGKEMKLVLGSNSTIPGFEQGLINAKPSEEVTLNLKFPDDYQAEHLAGKMTVFKVKVQQVMEPVLPELNDEFFEQLQIKGGIDTLRTEILNNLTREKDKLTREKLHDDVCNKIIELSKFDIPKALMSREINHLKHEAEERLKKEMKMTKIPQLPDDIFQARAERRVKLGLLLSKLVSAFELKADPERVRRYIEQLAAPYEHPEAVIDWYYGSRENIDRVQSIVLEHQAIDKLLEQATVNEKQVTYNEIMNISKE